MKLRDRPKKGKNTEVPRIEIQNTYDNKRPNEERVFHWGLVSRRGAGLHKLNFSYTRFRGSKTVLGASPCTLEIVQVTNNNMIRQ